MTSPDCQRGASALATVRRYCQCFALVSLEAESGIELFAEISAFMYTHKAPGPDGQDPDDGNSELHRDLQGGPAAMQHSKPKIWISLRKIVLFLIWWFLGQTCLLPLWPFF